MSTPIRTVSLPAVWTECRNWIDSDRGPGYELRLGLLRVGHVAPSGQPRGGYMAAVHCVMALVQWHPTREEAMRDVESVIAGHETEEVVL